MQFQPGKSGNPSGRRRGSRNKSTLLRERLATKGVKLLDRLIALAENGDVDCLKFLVGRLLPVPKDTPIALDAPGTNLRQQGESILTAALSGSITPSEAADLLSCLSAQVRIVEAADLEARLEQLEKAYATSHPKARN